MTLNPWLSGTFDALWGGLNSTQDNERCIKFELNAADCLEAYGKHHANKKCIDYMDDLRECIFRNKQNMRVVLMRNERARQLKAGEREIFHAPGPVEDAY
ncbi:uncharacterized protein LOC122499204 [Leptopilina heterotoma]|uniref:uncharacterized protein LOC122499204 n=1 Tax=Leptopilina heterotoma TaxID=63436 RepID=UPI001CAA27A4|nr:uncharacterized protein LOC122499204 [Leptopilina heterotoma]